MKIVVGLSGGVDSSTTIYLLKKAGHEVYAVSMIVYNSDYLINEANNAKKIAEKLQVKHRIVDVSKEFDKIVLSNFFNGYKTGKTPNPCAICNQKIKFKLLLDIMNELGYDNIATGHYANVAECKNGNEVRYAIKKSKNRKKDQSYLLYNLTQEQLKRIIFPLSDMDKDEIRSIANNFDNNVSKKEDSFDLCFVKDMDYKEFINIYEYGDDYKEKIAKGEIIKKEECGEIVDLNGKVIGYHKGIKDFTIGQRRGINIGFGSRKYVLDIDYKNNRVVIGEDEDLYKTTFLMSQVNFQSIKNFQEGIQYKYKCKIRYRHEETDCAITKVGNIYKCIFDKPVRAITKGQSAVFYDNDIIVLGGEIDEVC